MKSNEIYLNDVKGCLILISLKNFKKKFETSLIEPEATDTAVVQFIEKCKEYTEYLAGTAFNLHQLPLGVKLLKNTDIDAVAINAYPIGGLPTAVKVAQAKYAIKNGAQQIDMVMDVNAFKSGKYDLVQRDIEAVLQIAEGKVNNLSVIPGTIYLTNEEKRKAARIITEAGATIIKANDGFGAVTSIEDVKLIKEEVGDSIKIMASGGIFTAKLALEIFDAGADLIATAKPFKIVDELDIMFQCAEGKK